MPLYEYQCRDCEALWEVFLDRNDVSVQKCSTCGYNTYRVMSIGHIGGCNSPTLGSLAEKNTKAMGSKVSETIQSMANERRGNVTTYKGKIPEGGTPKPYQEGRPWWRQDSATPDYSLNKLTNEQKEKYIMEGKKPIT